MTEQMVRCPYCFFFDQFRPMVERPSWFVCEQCGHVLLRGDPDFKCACDRCMQLKRAA